MLVSELTDIMEQGTPCIVFTDAIGLEDIDGVTMYPDELGSEVGGMEVQEISLAYIGETARLGVRIG